VGQESRQLRHAGQANVRRTLRAQIFNFIINILIYCEALMYLSQKTLEKLRFLINEDMEYRSGPKLVDFFNN